MYKSCRIAGYPIQVQENPRENIWSCRNMQVCPTGRMYPTGYPLVLHGWNTLSCRTACINPTWYFPLQDNLCIPVGLFSSCINLAGLNIYYKNMHVCPAVLVHPRGYPVILHGQSPLSYRISCVNPTGDFLLQENLCIHAGLFSSNRNATGVMKYILQEYTWLSCRTNASSCIVLQKCCLWHIIKRPSNIFRVSRQIDKYTRHQYHFHTVVQCSK